VKPVAAQPAAVSASAATQARPTPIPPASIPVVAATKPPATLAPPATSTAATNANAGADTYRKVQTALNQIGYGPIPTDGNPGRDSADAIRRFQLDYGLSVTGIPDDSVVKRLIAIGAIAAR
jgi:peptidoglycan hydrolase-like protein with peptidoglycan-binding domain